MRKAADMTGLRFGRLVVKERDWSKRKAAYWVCLCDCGNTATVQATHLRSGATQSCGCLNREKHKNEKHGASYTRLYREWGSMKDRCYRESGKEYADYGGRGIEVCPEWRDSFEAFRDWALANGYRDDLTIERNDVNGDYRPENCRWATQKEQQNNKRNNRLLTYEGRTMTISQWADETGLKWSTIYDRIRNGWSVERALTEPTNTTTNTKPNNPPGRASTDGCG